MSHMLEIVNGVAKIAWAGEKPWHSLGKEVSNDLTTDQMQKESGTDWLVEKVPAYCDINSNPIQIGRSALVRLSDNKILDIVTDDWNPVQNHEAFDFFHEYVMAGDMEMNTAGSLRGGQVVWCLAKIKESFELFKGDVIEAYLLFSNFHRYGWSTDVRFTPTRVVCNNTLTLALSTKGERMIKVSHRNKFDAESVKTTLGIATAKLDKYKEMAQFLGSKQAKNEDMIEYFKRVFPVSGEKKKKEMSKNATLALAAVDMQPGAEFARNSWWQPYNAVTFMVDHVLGRNDDNRLASSWYGSGRELKLKALETAIEFAEKV